LPLSSGSESKRNKSLRREADVNTSLSLSSQLFKARMLISSSYVVRNINKEADVTVLFRLRPTVSEAQICERGCRVSGSVSESKSMTFSLQMMKLQYTY
jgi:carbamoylphosphate synthase large subunit